LVWSGFQNYAIQKHKPSPRLSWTRLAELSPSQVIKKI
jgi:hypothetical protein